MSASSLEAAVDAYIACLAAWCYSADEEVRDAASVACSRLGVDYIGSVASRMADDDKLSADAARLQVANGFQQAIVELLHNGQRPRDVL